MNYSTKMLLTFALAAVTSTAASAEPATGVVRFDDLDLSRPADVRILHKRMDQAANAICLNPTGPSPAVIVDATCKSDAVRAARAQVGVLLASRQPLSIEPAASTRSGE